jgi:hypoxanthine phosphoribosyltransferase
MDVVKVHDKTFRLSIPEEKIMEAVDSMAQQISRDYSDKDPVFIAVLNGAFVFASDLLKRINFPCSISFVKIASYAGTSTTGNVKSLIGLNEDLEGKNIVVIEDIIDSGTSMKYLLEELKKMNPLNIRIASLLFKPDAFREDYTIDYIGISIPNDFIVGYGLDYNGYGRNLRQIYTVVE